MGISFKLSKVGRRYSPKSLPTDDLDTENDSENEVPATESECDFAKIGKKVSRNSITIPTPASDSVSEELEVSFIINLFLDGFYVGKPNELQDDAHEILPYDRVSKSFFSEIEYGWLPGNLLDDIPCKYVDGSLLCEIRDYRNILSDKNDKSPIVHKVVLQLTMNNLIKDIGSFSHDSWTYDDLLKAESHILKAMKPVLNLNPEPMLGIFGEKASAKKIDLKISWTRKRKTSDAFVNKVTRSDEISCTQNSKSTPWADEGDKEISVERRTIPRCGPTSNSNSNMLKNHYFSKTQTCSVRPTVYIPRQELIDLSDPLRQQSDSEICLDEKNEYRKRSLIPVNCVQQDNLEDILKLPPEIVKDRSREMVEFSHFAKSSKLVEISSPSDVKRILNEKRDDLKISQTSSGIQSKSFCSGLADSSPTNTSIPTEEKSKYCLGGSGTLRDKYIAIMQKELSANGVIGWFSKIQMLTQSYGLSEENHKCNHVLENKPSMFYNPNLDRGGAKMKKWQFGNNTRNSLPTTRRKNVIIGKTRILKFARALSASQRNKIGSDESQTTLYVVEKFLEGLVEASIVYGGKISGLVDFPRLQTFPNLQYANAFVAQFTKLMEREGCYLVSVKIEDIIDPPIVGARQPKSSRGQISYVLPTAPAPSYRYQERQCAINSRQYILRCHQMEREKIELQQLQQRRTIMMLREILPAGFSIAVQPGHGGTSSGLYPVVKGECSSLRGEYK